jgi:branched-chain amino acid transport system ATP-binding protein
VASAGALLRVENSTKQFGGLVANHDVSLEIHGREIVGLIGPNGAGKTTLFNCISGHYHPDRGRILFDGHDVSRTRPDRICHRGVARTWQIVRAFGRMSVVDNVICGALTRTNSLVRARAKALAMLEFTGLRGKEDEMAAALTLADKKRLEITRALATAPRLLLLDEAMSGLTPTETAGAVELVRRIHADLNLAICVVEHVMEVVMPLSHRVVVLDHGEKIADGPPEVVVRIPEVIAAYLGDHGGQRG